MQTTQTDEAVRINLTSQCLFCLSFWASLMSVGGIVLNSLSYTFEFGMVALLSYQFAFECSCNLDSFPIKSVVRLRLISTCCISLFLVVLSYNFMPKFMIIYGTLGMIIIMLEILAAQRTIKDAPFKTLFQEEHRD